MSLRKIVGTETELRLDYQPDSPEMNSPSLSKWVEEEEYYWPSVVIKEAFAVANQEARFYSQAEPPPMVRDVDPTNDDFRLEPVLDHLERGQSLKTREEIVNHQQGPNESSSSAWDCYSEQRHRRQRLGLSGGYTVSGFRLYVDGTHPEISTPECSSPFDLVCWEKAGEQLAVEGSQKAMEKHGGHLTLYKNNSDGRGNSWGAHENYLLDNQLFETLMAERGRRNTALAVKLWATYLVTRLIFTGAGKIGQEVAAGRPAQFLISSRAEFLFCLHGLSTVEKRGLINLRDIPYTTESHGRRLHVIAGDANRCETAIFLKVGTAMIILMMLEDQYFNHSFPFLIEPVESLKKLMQDYALKDTLTVQRDADQQKMTALEINQAFLEEACRWYQQGRSAVENSPWIWSVLQKWERFIKWLKNHPEKLAGECDWITKQWIFEGILQKEGGEMSWENLNRQCLTANQTRAKDLLRHLKGVDLAYHRLGPKSLFAQLERKGKTRPLIAPEKIAAACHQPPADTRAYQRGKFLKEAKRYPDIIRWDDAFNFTDQPIGNNWLKRLLSLRSIYQEEEEAKRWSNPWRTNDQ